MLWYLFSCYMTINSNQNHVTFLYIEFLLGYLNIDFEFEVQKKLWPNPDQLISMPMEYWTPYPWYIDPPTHGISTPLPMVYRPPHPIQLLTFNAVYSWLYGPGQWMIDQGRIVMSRLKLKVNNCLLNNKEFFKLFNSIFNKIRLQLFYHFSRLFKY